MYPIFMVVKLKVIRFLCSLSLVFSHDAFIVISIDFKYEVKEAAVSDIMPWTTDTFLTQCNMSV